MYTAIRIADILDRLCIAHDAAVVCVTDASWLRAIDKAWGWLLQQDVIEFDPATHSLRMESESAPGTFYEANGACRCPAFTSGAGVCYHRAAARLVRRAMELQPA